LINVGGADAWKETEDRRQETGLSTYKFQNLEVYKLALFYIKYIYELTIRLPQRENFNLVSQIQRAATSIALNIAEGSTGQSNPE